MASIQARHKRACEFGDTYRVPGTEGCTCDPTLFVLVRQGPRTLSHRAGKNMKVAKRLLAKIQVREDEGTLEEIKPIRFDKWGGEWINGLERKEGTKLSYRGTVRLAESLFGHKQVKKITPADIRAFNVALRERGMSDSTRAKHLRVLRKCFSDAVDHGYAAQNPVKRLPRSEKPEPSSKEAAYFESSELPKLFQHIHGGLWRIFFTTALKTGLRLGELCAMTWGDVNLSEGAIHVRRAWTGGRLDSPKNRKRRVVDISSDLVSELGAWWGECGHPADNVLVFPGSRSGTYLHEQVVRAALYNAMKDAEISREGPTGERRGFHSLRHTFAMLALTKEPPASMSWLSRHLGHSTLAVTSEIYGHLERSARRREAEGMSAAFVGLPSPGRGAGRY
jgi:integrase